MATTTIGQPIPGAHTNLLRYGDTTFFKSPYFSVQGKPYTIVSSTKKGNDMIHTVKNQDGQYRDFTHNELVAFHKPTP